jgi:outer membrane protease
MGEHVLHRGFSSHIPLDWRMKGYAAKLKILVIGVASTIMTKEVRAGSTFKSAELNVSK